MVVFEKRFWMKFQLQTEYEYWTASVTVHNLDTCNFVSHLIRSRPTSTVVITTFYLICI